MLNSVHANATRLETSFNHSSLRPVRNHLALQVSAIAQGQRLLVADAGTRASCAPSDKVSVGFPVYWGGLVETPWDVISDQDTFDKACASIIDHLKTHTLCEGEMFHALETGFFQRPMGKLLADLFVEAMMRSIEPKGELTTQQLREIVETICKLPPGEWANAFGERLNFPRGADRNSVIGFIQSQLDLSRAQRAEKIANNELLTDEQWQGLQKVVRECRSSIRPWQEGRLNSTLMKLEDCATVRRSPEETKFLLGEFLQRLNEPRRERFPDRQKIAVDELWRSIELPPTSSLLEEVKEWIDPASLRAGLQRVVDQTNSALNTLGALTSRELGEVFHNGASSAIKHIVSAVTMAGFVFRSAPQAAQSARDDSMEIASQDDFSLMERLEEIERKSDFYAQVKIDGPRIPNGLAARLLYAGHVVHEVSGLVSSLRPSSPTAPEFQAPSFTPRPETSASDSVKLFEQLESLIMKIDELFTRVVQGATAWTPVSAVDPEALREQLNTIKTQLSNAHLKTPFAHAPPSSYGTAGNPYASTVEALEAGPLEKLRVGLKQWLQTNIHNVAAGSLAALNTLSATAQRHPRATATVAFAAIYAAVNDFYSRWFGDSLPGADGHFVQEEDQALRKYISEKVAAKLSKMPDLVQSVRVRLATCAYADPHRDPQLIPDIKMLLSKPAPSQPEQTVAELIDESIFESRYRYAQLGYSRLFVDEDELTPVADEHLPVQPPVDNSAQWVLEAVSDSSSTSLIDQSLQALLLSQLEANQNVPLSVPEDSLMSKPVALFQQTLNEPAVLAWFESKGLVLNTVVIHENAVSGTVVVDGVSSTQIFGAWDGSGWWQVSAHVLAARKVVDPADFGMPFLKDDQSLVPCNVLLDFFKVVVPISDEGAAALASSLKKDGWPEITADYRAEINQECDEVAALIAETKSRAQLSFELEKVAQNLPDEAPVSLSGRYTRSANHLPLADKCSEIVEDLNDFLKLPKMVEICTAAKIDCTDSPVRISDNKIQVSNLPGQWYDLTSRVKAQSTLTGPLDDLLRKVKATGNTLYSTLSLDLQQVVDYRGFGSPKTAGEVRNVMRWLNTTLPSAPPLGDYAAQLLGGGGSLIKLTPADRATLIGIQNTFVTETGSIIEALGADLLAGKSIEYRRTNVDELLGEMFKKDQSDAWGHQLLMALGWYGAGATALPEHYQQLLLAAIKLGVDPDAPGKPGTVAGYDVYQPKNLGRDLTTVRAEIEQHLIENKGVSAQSAPMVAHLFLADAAPEFLVQSPDKRFLVGTASWMTLRLGVVIAESLTPGSSRAMTADQLMALALLTPTTPEQHLLFKSASVDILMVWGVMNGVIQSRPDAAYSLSDYTLIANRFAAQRAAFSQAIEGFSRPLLTRRELAIREIGKVFSPFTSKPIEELEIDNQAYEQHQVFPGPVIKKNFVEAYMDGELNAEDWQLSDDPMSVSTFNICKGELPDLNNLLTTSVDEFFNARKQAFTVSTQAIIARLSLEDRQCLELGEVKLFTLREETGKPKEDETAQIQAAFRGRQGTLVRCEYQQKISYFEVFPGQLSIVKRTDLPDDLPLNGVIKIEKAKISKGSTVNVQVQRGTELPFDFAAYSEGTAPVAGAKSKKLIIESFGSTLAAVSRQGSEQATPVPDSYGSTRTATIVDRIINGNYLQGERDFLFEKAKGQTTAEENREYWKKVENFLVQLIPFVGCTDDLQSGDRMRFINGAFGCFADLVSGLNTVVGGIGRINRVLSSVVPVSVKAFDAIKITGSTVISMINPLDGLPSLIIGGARAVNSLRRILTSGVFALSGSGIGHLQVCVDRLRAYFGGAASAAAGQLTRSATSTLLRVNGTLVTKTDDKWFALDNNGNPIGRALDPAIVLKWGTEVKAT